MAIYVCPNQYRHNAHKFIMCKDLLPDVKRIQDPQEAIKAYCPHQKYCSCSNGAENTEQAKTCYKSKTNQTASAD